MSKGEREITSKLKGERKSQGPKPTREKVLRGRERELKGERKSRGSQMLDVQEERCHMSFWGKDMFV